MSQLSKLKQFNDLRKAAKDMQKKLAQETALGEGAGGKVSLVMDGNQEVLSVDVDDSLMSVGQKGTLEQGIKEAVNKAAKNLQKLMAKKMQAGEMEMPDLSGLMKKD